MISHDLGTVLEATDRVVVMYGGELVEDQPAEALQQGGHHPYTEALMNCYADPRADEVHLGSISGSPPDLSLPGGSCPFTPRCRLGEEICKQKDPELTPLGTGVVACHVRAREESKLSERSHVHSRAVTG
ncbi:MAG: oligopeptide/dipeptide ABC transporter ATP-binding protein [Acidimicrobiales bacterium]